MNEAIVSDEQQYVSLYAQPHDENPFVALSKLKSGVYETCTKMSTSSFIRFSDVGVCCWNTAKFFDPSATIRLEETSHLEEDKVWEVTIKSRNLTVMLKSIRYKTFGDFTKAFYISVDLMGTQTDISSFVNRFVSVMEIAPYEIADWKAFKKKCGAFKDYVVDSWMKHLGYKESISSFMLFAQPKQSEPRLILSQLKKGIYKPWAKMSALSYIKFTEIGQTTWKIVREMVKGTDENASIRLVTTSPLEEDKVWEVLISISDLDVRLKSVRYKMLGSFPAGFYTAMELKGEQETLIAFSKKLCESLDGMPWELNNWEAFTKKANMSKEDVVSAWIPFIPKASEDTSEIKVESLKQSKPSIDPKDIARSMTIVRAAIRKGKKKRIKYQIAEELLTKAEVALSKEDLELAKSLAQKAKAHTRKAKRFRDMSFEKIQSAHKKIDAATNSGKDASVPKTLLEGARAKIRDGNYEDAYKLARESLAQVEKLLL